MASGSEVAPAFPMPTTLAEFMISCGARGVSDADDPIKQNDVKTANGLERELDAATVPAKEAVAKKDAALCSQLGTKVVVECLFHKFYRSVGHRLSSSLLCCPRHLALPDSFAGMFQIAQPLRYVVLTTRIVLLAIRDPEKCHWCIFV